MTDGPFTLKDLESFQVYHTTTTGHLLGVRGELELLECLNARYRELHPPVSEELKFTAKDFLDEENRAAVQALEASCLFPMNLVSRLEQLGEISANNANTKLQRILAQGVRVYFMQSGPGFFHKDRGWPGDTHTGIVVNIEEIKK